MDKKSLRRRQFSLTLALITLLGFWLPSSAVKAEIPLLKHGLKPELLLPSQTEVLSGRTRLVVTGQDLALHLKEGLGKEGRGELSEVKLQAVGAGGAAFIPYRSPAVKFSRNILLSRDAGRLPYQTEPNLAVNPKDPEHIIAGVIDYNFPGIVTYVSLDGGATWTGPSQPKFPRGELVGVGDPTIAFDRQGNSCASQISLRIDDFALGNLVGSALVASIGVSYSTDGGITWREAILAARGGVETEASTPAAGERLQGEVGASFLDKPWLSVGANAENPNQDVLYITYTNFTDRWVLRWMDEVPVLMIVEEQASIELVRSEDGGLSWSRPIQVSPRVFLRGGEGLASRAVQGSQPMVAPDGTLYVAWFDSTTDGTWKGVGEIWVATSKDLGRTFSQPRLADKFLEVGFWPRSTSFRLWATVFPQLATGPKGEVYLVYTAFPTDNPEDGGDVFLVASFDGGKTWARRVKINDDKSERLQFFPAMAVDPEGSLHVIWGDMRDDPTELSYHIYYSSSKDGGKTWEVNSRVSDFPSNPNFAFPRGQFIGDYFTIKTTKEDIYIAWADGRLGEVGGTNQKIGFARKRLMPAPSIFISPPSGSAGRDIIVQGHNFQPESEIFLDMGGVLAATGRTTIDGTFSLTIFAPISGEGAKSVIVRDISGNAAIASFYTEFGFDSFQKSISRLEEQLAKPGTKGLPASSQATSGGFLWLVTALAIALAVALLALVLLWYRAYSRRRG